MSSQTHILRAWNEYREVPAIHAAGIVSVFFCAAFLNFGWMLVVFAAYALMAVRSLRSRKVSSVLAYVQCLSLEVAVLLFGILYEVCFQAWMPVFPTLNPMVRTSLWLMLAAVLLSTKFFLIARIVDASADDRWFQRASKEASHVYVAFALLIASLGVFLFAQFGPAADQMSALIMRMLVPGIL